MESALSLPLQAPVCGGGLHLCTLSLQELYTTMKAECVQNVKAFPYFEMNLSLHITAFR